MPSPRNLSIYILEPPGDIQGRFLYLKLSERDLQTQMPSDMQNEPSIGSRVM